MYFFANIIAMAHGKLCKMIYSCLHTYAATYISLKFYTLIAQSCSCITNNLLLLSRFRLINCNFLFAILILFFNFLWSIYKQYVCIHFKNNLHFSPDFYIFFIYSTINNFFLTKNCSFAFVMIST